MLQQLFTVNISGFLNAICALLVQFLLFCIILIGVLAILYLIIYMSSSGDIIKSESELSSGVKPKLIPKNNGGDGHIVNLSGLFRFINTVPCLLVYDLNQASGELLRLIYPNRTANMVTININGIVTNCIRFWNCSIESAENRRSIMFHYNDAHDNVPAANTASGFWIGKYSRVTLVTNNISLISGDRPLIETPRNVFVRCQLNIPEGYPRSDVQRIADDNR